MSDVLQLYPSLSDYPRPFPGHTQMCWGKDKTNTGLESYETMLSSSSTDQLVMCKSHLEFRLPICKSKTSEYVRLNVPSSKNFDDFFSDHSGSHYGKKKQHL